MNRQLKSWGVNISSDVRGSGVADERMEVATDRVRWRGLLIAVMDSRAWKGHLSK